MLRRLTGLAVGRRTKWLVIGAWVVAAIGLAQFQPKLTTLAADESDTFLVRGSESAAYDEFVKNNFDYGNEKVTLVVFQREGGLTSEDASEIGSIAYDFCQAGQVKGITRVVTGAGFDMFMCGKTESELDFGSRPVLISADGSVQMLVITDKARDTTTVTENIDAIRANVPAPDADGLRAFVTGEGGFEADRAKAVEGIDETLMIITALLILVILLAIYRSPFIAGVPLAVVAIAYLIAAGVIFGLVEAGLTTISGQTTAILIVLMFGAGTDYCLLILSRYRDELKRYEDHHEAMARAISAAAPAILSSGVIVVAVMATLGLADFNATREMGPLLALGILVMMAAGFTLLPATLTALGRRAFWPRKPLYEPALVSGEVVDGDKSDGSSASRPGPSGGDADGVAISAARPATSSLAQPEVAGIWKRVSGLIARKPRTVAIAVTGLLLLGAMGNLGGRDTLDFTDAFREAPESVLGQEVVRDSLGAGRLGPVNLVMANDLSGDVVPRVADIDGVSTSYWAAASRPVGENGEGGNQYIVADITLELDPFAESTADFIPELKAQIEGLVETALESRPGFEGDTRVLLGGISAENHDTAVGVARDTRIIVPIALLLILLILAVQLRAIIAPLYLVGTVILSFFFALGVASLVFTHIFGQSGSDPNLEIFAFIFLVGLGVDYNIFLISRIREERLAGSDTRTAVLAGLEKTGGVITSAGLILAGTFSALMALTFEAMFQFGFVIAFGLLVDTFIVRIFLVPSIAYMLDEKNWWPWGGGKRKRAGETPELSPAAPDSQSQ